MASKKKRKARGRSPKGDQFSYAEFMKDLIEGVIKASDLIDQTVNIGEIDIQITTIDSEENTVIVSLKHPIKAIASFEYDEPDDE